MLLHCRYVNYMTKYMLTQLYNNFINCMYLNRVIITSITNY